MFTHPARISPISRLFTRSRIGVTVATLCFMAVAPLAVDAAQPLMPDQPLTQPQQTPMIEAVFVLDTTGSMGGLIQAAKDKIWSIASTMAAAKPAPLIRLGLVAYRDLGDDYVTRVVDLTKDLDMLQAELMQLQAQGGGDGPESVNQALHEAVQRISWSQDPQVYRVIFLVGDAPAHMDYPNDVPYPQTLATAKRRGIRVNAIQCGALPETTQEWQRIAQLGNGSYAQVEQSGGAVAITTPYDAPLAKLSAELDATRLYYGQAEERAKQEAKLATTKATQAAAAPAVAARRAEFVASDSGKASLKDENELIEDVTSGRVELADLPAAQLPAPLADLTPEARRDLIKEQAAKREALQQQIKDLSAQRAAYLKSRVEAEGGAESSLDHQIFEAVREQAAEKGLRYDKTAPVY